MGSNEEDSMTDLLDLMYDNYCDDYWECINREKFESFRELEKIVLRTD